MLSLVLHFVAEPAAALAEVHRALRPKGGRLLIVDMLPHDREEYRQTMGHVWLGFDATQLSQWADDAGFSTVRRHALPVSVTGQGSDVVRCCVLNTTSSAVASTLLTSPHPHLTPMHDCHRPEPSTPSTPSKSAGRPPFKVKDLALADWGRKEIRLAEHEMPGLMALRAEYGARSRSPARRSWARCT